MRKQVRRVAVLGSGVMGGAIAAHFANVGVPALLLDLVPSGAGAGGRDALAEHALARLRTTRPAPLYSAARAAMIEPGNFEDDLPRLREADWIVEVVKEDLEVKRRIFEAIAPHVAPHAILSTNTSGLSIETLARGLPAPLRPRFLGTHFFNPPRYMKLLEVIPASGTSPEILEFVREFGSTRLGKGIVLAKDTPNFIANRIGVHAMMVALRVMAERGLTIEEVDLLTGPPLGRPKTGTFRLADLVGLDTLAMVAGTVRDGAPADESREVFDPPPFLRAMVERGLLGLKSGAGFYRKDKRSVLTLDVETLEYRPARVPEFPELAALRRLGDPGRRIATLVAGEGRAAGAAWALLAPTLSYAACRLGEIADDVGAIDEAIRLGFNWELGPFEIWESLGLATTAERLRDAGHAVPPWVGHLVAGGAETFRRAADGGEERATASGGWAPARPDPRAVDLEGLRRAGKEVRRNDSASLVDLGQGVLGLEFHSKLNAIDAGTIEMMEAAVAEAEANWRAIVVANGGESFSVGANLALVLQAIGARDWATIERIVAAFQQANDRLERAAVPVVVAPHGRALGGGCEVLLAGRAVVAAAELYTGLVEVGAGVVPAGGGCLRLYKRLLALRNDDADLYGAVRRAFETIGMARVSSSAEEARELGFLRPADRWTSNRDHVIHDAVAHALSLAGAAFEPARADRAIPVMGRSGLAVVESAIVNLTEGRFASEHDAKIARELGRILCGGDVAGPTTVSERHVLDLERESFLRLCGEPLTAERMRSILETGKPLRN